MAQKCNELNCNNEVFGGHKCKYHQYKRHMQGGDLFVRKAKKKAVEPRSDLFGSIPPPESKKRKKAHIYYSKGCRELEAEIRVENKGKIYCFFSEQEIRGFVTWHHLLGRSGDYYTDREFLVPAINEYHLEYHRMTIEQLESTEWYSGFLERLKSKCPQAYQKELRKQDKKANINRKNLED